MLKKPWLVQSGFIINNPEEVTDFDSVVRLNYMGAAEYEDGSVQKSLAEIRKNSEAYNFLTFTFKESDINVYFNSNLDDDAVIQHITSIATRLHRTKCGTSFPVKVNPTPSDKKWQEKHPEMTNFWWDIENHIMWWIADASFLDRFLKVI